jgi:hypothetical protein
MEPSIWNNLDPIAVYAALVATAVVVWDVYKWWRSERVRLTGFISPNMITHGGATTPQTKGNKYLLLRVQNRGTVTCTVQLVHLKQYKSWFDELRGKTSLTAIVNHTTNFGPEIPFRLGSGDEFSSGILQNDELEQLSRDGRLYVGISHTMSGKSFFLRVPPIKPTHQDKATEQSR